MWNPSEFNSASSPYLNSDYSFDLLTDEGNESSSTLAISNEYDKIFFGDWYPSDYSSESHVNSGVDISGSPLSPSPFPSMPSNNYSAPTVFGADIAGAGGENLVETMRVNTGDVQFGDSQAISVTELDLFVETEEGENRGESPSREPKKHKPCNGESLLQEASSSATKKKAKGPAKKHQRIGPKIQALQRLISPYGKTDAASVLNETANNIRYLHEQIKILTGPYMGTHRQQALANTSCDLRSRGLCLVPVTPELVNLTSQLPSARSVSGSILPFSNRSVPGSTIPFSNRNVPGSTIPFSNNRNVPGSTIPFSNNRNVPGSTVQFSNHGVPGSTVQFSNHGVPESTVQFSNHGVPGSTVQFSNHGVPGSAVPFSRFGI